MNKSIRRLFASAGALRRILSAYSPYLGAGIRVTHIADDFSCAAVEMRQRWYNTNYVGTHFGGSLYSMVDPMYMLLLMRRLGNGYIVWDKSAHIEFIRPGRGKVVAHFELTDERLDEIRAATADGEKMLPPGTSKCMTNKVNWLPACTRCFTFAARQTDAGALAQWSHPQPGQT